MVQDSNLSLAIRIVCTSSTSYSDVGTDIPYIASKCWYGHHKFRALVTWISSTSNSNISTDIPYFANKCWYGHRKICVLVLTNVKSAIEMAPKLFFCFFTDFEGFYLFTRSLLKRLDFSILDSTSG